MTNIKITFNSAGFRAILLSDGVRDLLEKTSGEIAARANANLTDRKSEGFEAHVWEGAMMSKYGHGGRWLASVSALDSRAAADEAEHKSLSKAVR